MSSPKTWSLTCCKKVNLKTWCLQIWGVNTLSCLRYKTLLSTIIKAFHIFPHTVASNIVFRQKYVLSEKDCLCPVIKIVHKYLMPQNFGNILFHLPTIQYIISNISETHRFSPQMRLIAYPDHKTTAHNWQKWKRVFLTCPCHKIHRVEAVGLKTTKYTWKIIIFVNMWNLEQFR